MLNRDARKEDFVSWKDVCGTRLVLVCLLMSFSLLLTAAPAPNAAELASGSASRCREFRRRSAVTFFPIVAQGPA